jgi:hypothetical protein
MSRGPKDKKRPPAAPLPAKRSPYKKRLSENQLPQISNNDGCKVGGTARDRMRRYRALARQEERGLPLLWCAQKLRLAEYQFRRRTPPIANPGRASAAEAAGHSGAVMMDCIRSARSP